MNWIFLKNIKNHIGKLKTRHGNAMSTIPTVRVEKLLRLLQITMSGRTMDEAVKEVEKEFTISHFEDMNKLSDEQLQRRKELMDINFEKNRIQPGDKDYIYDKQVDFGQPEVESGWDNEDGNEDSDFW